MKSLTLFLLALVLGGILCQTTWAQDAILMFGSNSGKAQYVQVNSSGYVYVQAH